MRARSLSCTEGSYLVFSSSKMHETPRDNIVSRLSSSVPSESFVGSLVTRVRSEGEHFYTALHYNGEDPEPELYKASSPTDLLLTSTRRDKNFDKKLYRKLSISNSSPDLFSLERVCTMNIINK